MKERMRRGATSVNGRENEVANGQPQNDKRYDGRDKRL